jgi:two-component system, chemotaxis family, CheB/CheR fusion protein
LQAFHYALKPAGFLVLGKSETTGSSSDLFETIDKDFKIYSKKATLEHTHFDFSFNTRMGIQEDSRQAQQVILEPVVETNVEKETDRLLLSRYVPTEKHNLQKNTKICQTPRPQPKEIYMISGIAVYDSTETPL